MKALSVAEKFHQNFMPEPNSGCWLWTGTLDGRGYGRLAGGKRGRALRAHRVALELYRGPIAPGLFVCHRCDTPSCVNPGHLFLGDHAANMADMAAKGRARGEDRSGARNPRAKMTDEGVAQIRASTDTPAELSKRFSLSVGQIRAIRNRTAWGNKP